jgi:hypothetical protein
MQRKGQKSKVKTTNLYSGIITLPLAPSLGGALRVTKGKRCGDSHK